MAKNFIDAFISNMRDKGFVKQNRFLVIVEPNSLVSQQLGFSAEEIKQRLMMTCASATLPSKSFLTHEIQITQPTRMVPYAINSNNSSGASFEFHVLGDMFEKNIFEMWQNIIIDPKTKQQSYYDDFAKGSSIVIIEIPNMIGSFDAAMEALAGQSMLSGMRLTEAYPYNFTINGGSQNYSGSQEPMKVKVDFMFREITPIKEPKPRGIDSSMRVVDQNGNFTRRTARESIDSVLYRMELYRNRNKRYTANIPAIHDTPYRYSDQAFVNPNAVNATLEEAQADFREYQRREAKTNIEKLMARKQYDQTRNIPRGVDGRLLNPKVDGLPSMNPNDEISQILNQGLAFVSQAKGFLGL